MTADRDALDIWARNELAGTMLPCREISPEEKARIAASAQARNEILAAWFDGGSSQTKAA